MTAPAPAAPPAAPPASRARSLARAARDTLRYLPTRRLVWLVAAVAPLWLLSGSQAGEAAAAAAAGILVLLAVVDAVQIPSARAVMVERDFPRSAGIADESAGEYRVRTGWRAPLARGGLRARLYDDLPAAVERESPAPSPLRLEPGREVVIPVRFRGRARGVWPLGRVALRVSGPLGLAQRTLHYDPLDSIAVTPSLTGVRRMRLLAIQHRLRDAGVRAIRRRGEGTSFASLREYVVGDDPRRVDWKATARRRKLITREYTVEQGQTVIIAIDAGRLMTQLAGGLSRFELALSAATVLADIAVHSGDQVGLIVFDDEIRAFVPPMRGPAALQRLRNALVPLEATMTEPDYASAFRTLAARHRKRSLIVLFTDVIDPRASQAIIAHSSRSAARHLPIVVALRNDRLVEAALPRGTESSAELFEAAAAEELLQAREAALARMRRAGVSVLDVSPRAMTAAVVNRYLEIKARSSL